MEKKFGFKNILLSIFIILVLGSLVFNINNIIKKKKIMDDNNIFLYGEVPMIEPIKELEFQI